MRRWTPLWATLTGLLLGLGGACQKSAPPSVANVEDAPATKENDNSPGWFVDVTPQCGIQHVYRNGEEADHFAILESLGGGVALIDYDGDGRLDIFLTGGGQFSGPDRKTIVGLPNKLYRNLGQWKFQDVTKQVGLDGPLFYSHGATVGDIDNDGWPDLLVTGYGRVALFHNVADAQGQRRFVDVTEKAGLLGPNHFWCTSAVFADLDGDGFSDLYLCQYVNWSWQNDPFCLGYSVKQPRDVCPPKRYDAVPHLLYRNRGNGTFEDVSRSAGLRVDRPDQDYGKGLGVLAVDVDLDGRVDLYVANDTTDNFLYLNRSTPGNIRLEEVGLNLGVARDGRGVPNGSMGIDAADYDGSGRPSIWVTNYENEYHALYRNLVPDAENRLAFVYATPEVGLGVIGAIYVGFGTSFTDFDNDGWPDLVIANGHVVRVPPRDNLRQKPVLFRNVEKDRRRRFADVTAQGGSYFRVGHRGRGLAVGDLDNDGWPDLVFIPVEEPVAVLRNAAAFAPHHWLGVRLLGKDGRDIVGAKLTLQTPTASLTRFRTSGGSYLSSNDRRILFGLGSSTNVGRLTVEWPVGVEPRVQTFDGLTADRYWTITAGEAMAK